MEVSGVLSLSYGNVNGDNNPDFFDHHQGDEQINPDYHIIAPSILLLKNTVKSSSKNILK